MLPSRQDINDLKTYYNHLAWYKRWLFPSKLATVLQQPASKPSDICNIFYAHTPFWSWLLSGIWQFSNSKSYSIYRANLSRNSFWNKLLDFFDIEEAQEKQKKLNSALHADDTIGILKIMNDEQPLTPEEVSQYLGKIVDHARTDVLHRAIKPLQGTGLLSGEWRQQNVLALIVDPDLIHDYDSLEWIFKALLKTTLLNNDQAQNNFNRIMQRQLLNGWDLRRALTLSSRCLDLFTGEYAQDVFELIVGHKAPSRVTEFLVSLNAIGMNIKEYFPFLQHKSDNFWATDMDFILSSLKRQGLLAGADQQEIVWAVLHHERPYNLARMLRLLLNNNLLDKDIGKTNLNVIMQHERSDDLLDILRELDADKRLTQENLYLNYFGTHDCPHKQTLSLLNNAGLLTPDYAPQLLDALQKYHDASTINIIATITQIMSTSGLLNSDLDYIALINRRHSFLCFLSPILTNMSQARLLSPPQGMANFNTLLQTNYHGHNTMGIFQILMRVNLLSQHNFDQVLSCVQGADLFLVLYFFRDAGLLAGDNAQATLDLVIPHSLALQFLNRYITHAQLAAHWPRLAQILQRPLPPRALERALYYYIYDNILRIRGEVHHPDAPFDNAAQSTHTASVHVSTDLTAWLLLEKNAGVVPELNDLNMIGRSLQTTLQQEKEAVTKKIATLQANAELADEEQINELKVADVKLILLEQAEAKAQSAYDALKRLQEVSCNLELRVSQKKNTWAYLNETPLHKDANIIPLLPRLVSTVNQPVKLSLQQFIVWIYQDIQEKAVNNDYVIAMIDALYEIQRGYNLDEVGHDNGREAASICYGGTANKLCERLQGLSSLIQFIFMSDQTINLSIRQSIINQALFHCETLLTQANQGGQQEKTAFCNFINQLMDAEYITAVYESLFETANIEQQLKVEFKLYQILHGAQKLDDKIAEFKENSLLYLPPIEPENREQSFYTDNFLVEFNRFLNTKKEFEQMNDSLPDASALLASIGFMQHSEPAKNSLEPNESSARP